MTISGVQLHFEFILRGIFFNHQVTHKFYGRWEWSGMEFKKMPSALVILAEMAEETEVVITTDILRRAGMNVTVAGMETDGPVVCSRSVKILPDLSLTQALLLGPFDLIVLPGGQFGSINLGKSAIVGKVLKEQESAGRTIAAICAASTALRLHDIGKGKRATTYPLVKDQLKDFYDYQEERVVVDGNLITSQGPGTCFEFALTIVGELMGKEKQREITSQVLAKV